MLQKKKIYAMAALGVVGMAVAVPLATASPPSHVTSAPTPDKVAKPKAGTRIEVNTEHSSQYGMVLETGSGRTLYETTGKCENTACHLAWPPLVVKQGFTVGKGVSRKLLHVVKINNKQSQLSYGGHLLYAFSGDSRAHQYNGEGIASSGWGTWHVVSAATGKPVNPVTKAKTKKKSAGSGW